MDGWMWRRNEGKQMKGWMDDWMERKEERMAEEWMVGIINRMDGWMDEWIDVEKERREAKMKDRWMEKEGCLKIGG